MTNDTGAADIAKLAEEALPLWRVARGIRHHLATNLELRSNGRHWNGSDPSAKTSGYLIAEVPDWTLRQWLHAVEAAAEAATDNPEVNP